MKAVTGTLTKAQMEKELSDARHFLLGQKVRAVKVSFGWGCHSDIDLLWKESLVSVEELLPFVKDEGAKLAFSLGEGDLFIAVPDRAVEFLFCHESDVHFTSNDEGVVSNIISKWQAAGYPVHVVEENV